MRALSIVLAAALSGCTWVSKADLDERLPELDDDRDGVVAKDDCDDNDPDRFPGNEEIWYDGVDGDCLGGDDFDADADGHVPSEYQGIRTKDVKGTGLAPGGDCDDENAEVNPSVIDTWYDGIDSDCQGDDDFDKDRDGYASNVVAYGPTQYVSDSGDLLALDCDDDKEEVNPDAVDTPYDGIDSDCGGNDDFDVDGDGFYDEANGYAVTEYAEAATDPEIEGSTPASPGDCDDDDADINPAAEDIAYDGFDSDCGGEDDYDQDADGFVRDVDVGKGTYPVSLEGDLPGGDCQDDPTLGGAEQNPARVEILSDDVDQDCDSLTGAAGYNTFRLDPMADAVDFDDDDATLFIGVHSMVFGENAAGIHFGIGADGNDLVADAGVIEMFSFGDGDPLGGFSSGTDLITGSSAGTTPFDLSPTTAFWIDDDVSLSLTGAVFPTLRTLYLRGRDEVTGSDLSHAAGPTLPSGLSEWIPMTDVSLLRDAAGDFHGIGCDPITEVMQYVYDTPAALGLGTSDPGETSFARHRYTGEEFGEDFGASICQLFERDGQVLVLTDHDGTFRAHGIDDSGDNLVLLPETTMGLPEFDDDLAEASVQDIMIPRYRAPEPTVLVIDGFSRNVMVVNQDFDVIHEIDVALDIVHMDAVFAPDGILHVAVVDEAGVGWLYQLDLEDGVVNELRMPRSDLRKISLWIDDTTGNILQVMATTDPTGLVDPLVYGAAYLEDPGLDG